MVLVATVGVHLLKAFVLWVGPMVLPAVFSRPAPVLSPAPVPAPGRTLDLEIQELRRVIEANAAAISSFSGLQGLDRARLETLATEVLKASNKLDALALDLLRDRESIAEAKTLLAVLAARAEERERQRAEQLQAQAMQARQGGSGR